MIATRLLIFPNYDGEVIQNNGFVGSGKLRLYPEAADSYLLSHQKSLFVMDAGYQGLLQQLKQKIRQARQQVVLTVNKQLLAIYWEIGQAILIQQQKKGWGAKIIPQLAADLKTEFPELKGFSARNIKYMRAFAEAYPNFISVQPFVKQSETADNQEFEFVQPLVAQIPWAHHLAILSKLKSTEVSLLYIE